MPFFQKLIYKLVGHEPSNFSREVVTKSEVLNRLQQEVRRKNVERLAADPLEEDDERIVSVVFHSGNPSMGWVWGITTGRTKTERAEYHSPSMLNLVEVRFQDGSGTVRWLRAEIIFPDTNAFMTSRSLTSMERSYNHAVARLTPWEGDDDV